LIDLPLPTQFHEPNPNAIDEWLRTGSHIAPDTKKGMTLGGGVWPGEGPLTLIEKATGLGVKDLPFGVFSASVYDDFRARGMFSEAALKPEFNPLQMVKTNSETSLTSYDKNAWSPMHDVWGALLDDLDRIGVTWAGDALMRVAISWRNNATWGKYFNFTDNPSIPYQDAGRLRTAASICSVLFHLCRVLRRKADIGDVMAQGYLVSASQWLAAHLARIRAHLPLTAKPQGDHLPVPHVEVFMAGLLADVCRKIRKTGFEIVLCDEIIGRMEQIVQFARLPQFGPLCYAYDVAITPLPIEDGAGEFYIHPLTVQGLTGDAQLDKVILGRRPNGIGGVNTWIVRSADEDAQHAFVADALDQGWYTNRPLLWISHCGVK
jgi:hypothetical protein